MKIKKILKGILVHGALTYECEKCGKQWRMYLECGVAKCKSTLREDQRSVCFKCEVDGSMPCPFMIGCVCGGIAKHIDWHRDSRYPHPMPINNDISYFKIDQEGLEKKNPQACGIPIVRKRSRDLRG